MQRDPSVEGMITWDGDEWCAKLMEKPSSGPLVLDYTFIAGKGVAISAEVIKSGYSERKFKPDATSDHDLLFSTITLS